ncbi:DUF3618 domain-containing protein [Allosphingosinicella sp.]|jgi:hypothetical protein|uniref:DUF3618 domain-containing protein n=1 Tax=Allosphingosinicella sp. TaxID=2823234 RepID=UPI002EFFC12B
MSGQEILAARREALRCRRELDSSLVALQQRLHPRALATEAWDGVREKSSDMAESALDAVKQRPAAVSLAIGAVALFLARDPLRRAVGRMFSKDSDEDSNGDRITTRIVADDGNYNPAAPLVEAPPKEGAIT